tara:strand:+ start:49 stop:750 length:702 start_codon:yes stop_codon:yes gene_type:complete
MSFPFVIPTHFEGIIHSPMANRSYTARTAEKGKGADVVSDRRYNDALLEFLQRQCKERGTRLNSNVLVTAGLLGARCGSLSGAWQYLARMFLLSLPEDHALYHDALIRFGRAQAVQRAHMDAAGQEIQKNLNAAARDSLGGEVEGQGAERNGRKWQRVRYQALVNADGACVLCGRSQREHGVMLHVDHIKPASLFPSLEYDLDNLQVLCEDCNMGKGNRCSRDWRPEKHKVAS